MLRSRANEEPFEESYNGFAPLRAKMVFLFASSWAEIKLLFFGAFTSHESTDQVPKRSWNLRLVGIKKNFKRKRRVFANSKPAQSAEIFRVAEKSKLFNQNSF